MTSNCQRKSSTCNPRRRRTVAPGCEQNVTCVPCYYNGRPCLSRRAKYLLQMFLKPHVSAEVLEHAEIEFAVEPRRVQNLMAEKLFAILVDTSLDVSMPTPRQTLKLDDLAHRILASVNPFGRRFE